MTTVPRFNAKQAQSIQSFLDAPERSADSMRYAEAAGFLFSLACAPELVMPSDWMPIIIDPDNAEETSLDNKTAVTVGLMSLYNEMVRQVQESDVKFPHGIGFLDEVMANTEQDATISQWSRGFMQGYSQLVDVWEGYIPQELEEEFAAQLMVIAFFSGPKTANLMLEDVKNEDFTVESLAVDMKQLFPEAMDGIALLGNSIQDALATRGEPDQLPLVRDKKIGRNEPCPCGSGKKFKKCCGLAH